jgi:NADH-quinone oxidoreductase subunit N
MHAVNYLELLGLAAPETILTGVALAVLFADLAWLREMEWRFRRMVGVAISAFGCVVAILWIAATPEHASALDGMLVVDPLTQLVKQALLVLTAFTALLSIDSEFTEHVGEYFALILLATVGMMFLVSAEDILMIFVSLELTSLSLYILTAFNKRNVHSAEAALKYFLFGGMAAAFTLFGLSLLYGLSGATNLGRIAAALGGKGLHPLLVAALGMVVVGFGFKIAAVPFHLWAPDAYQGAPTPSAALIASGSKLASFFILGKVMLLGFAGVEGAAAFRQYAPGWVPVLAAVAALSMVLGNLVAIVQGNVRRLLAYSAIAHAGYALLGVLAVSQPVNAAQGFAALVYYMATYGLTIIGAFGVVSLVENGAGDARLSDFAGLSRRAPMVALFMMIFLLSLAGIPPLAGFFGKFYLFAAVLKADPKHLGLLWLVGLAVAASAVSLYYYLQVLKQIYVNEAADTAPRIVAPLSAQLTLGALALGVLALGCAPELLVGRLLAAAAGVLRGTP